jgi:formylglycine-generating enzyme required for sulfatase activity/serine/threonine protein kinase
VLGTLGESDAVQVEEHLATCGTCETTIQAMRGIAAAVTGARSGKEANPVREESGHQRALADLGKADSGASVKEDFDDEKTIDQPLDLGELGEYRLLEKLGEGGMGAVYKALQVNLEKIVAMKVLPKGRMGDEQATARFKREMKAVGQLEHPNIVRAMDAREIEGTSFLVMEYVDGQDLNELVRCVGPLAVPDACELIRQAALGLQCAHEHGLVHRDIKPSNLMLTKQGQVKLLDLGLARFSTEGQPMGREVTATGQIMGTPDYMAPEQITDTHGVDIRADIYSLGCTLYKLLAGRPPFSGPEYRTAFDKQMGHVKQQPPPIGRIRTDVSDELAAVVDRMLAKDAEERFATPAEVAVALEPFTAGCDIPGVLRQSRAIMAPEEESVSEVSTEDRSSALAATEPRIPPTPQPVGGRGWWKWVAVGAVLGGIVALGVILTLRSQYGTLVVESDDPNVQVAVKQNGEEVEIANAQSGWKVGLKSGKYDVELKGSAEQVQLDQSSVVVKRGDEVVVRVRLQRPEVQVLEKELTIDLPGGVKMEFVLMPAGEFMMGSSDAERQVALAQETEGWAKDRIPTEGPQHKVKISRPFYLGKYEVTQAQWEAVMGSNPSKFPGPMNPVEQVSWDDVQQFLAKLNAAFEKKGLLFGLPTEAGWEYACRAGTTTAFCFGDNPAMLAQYGWFNGNSGGKTHPVGQGQPNAWGLYDMHGNVWEWCSDWYGGDYYAKSPPVDPTGPPAVSNRVIRGGTWDHPPRRCRAAFRDNYGPGDRNYNLGCRLALVPADTATDAVKPDQPKPAKPPQVDTARASTKFKELAIELPGGAKMDFVLIPAGEFMMGSPDLERQMALAEAKAANDKFAIDRIPMEGAQHRVKITKPFYLGKYEVTQAQWQAVMDNNPSNFKGDLQRPVEQVSWEDAVAFCERLTHKERKTYRLPTEAEWEYACRAGSTTKWCFGDSDSELGDYAWYRSDSNSTTHAAGGKKPNAWGLYDMHGNVWEWCSDWYESGYYGSSPSDDPKGPSSGAGRVLRGGSWNFDAWYSRSAFRLWFPPADRIRGLGFRVARTP